MKKSISDLDRRQKHRWRSVIERVEERIEYVARKRRVITVFLRDIHLKSDPRIVVNTFSFETGNWDGAAEGDRLDFDATVSKFMRTSFAPGTFRPRANVVFKLTNLSNFSN